MSGDDLREHPSFSGIQSFRDTGNVLCVCGVASGPFSSSHTINTPYDSEDDRQIHYCIFVILSLYRLVSFHQVLLHTYKQ